MNRSSAATTAAASSGEAVGRAIVSFGRRFISGLSVSSRDVPAIPVLDYDAVLAAVSPSAAIERVREGLLRFHAGEWVMPPGVFEARHSVTSARCRRAAMRFALLKWVTSFPGNPARGLPTVTGVICLSNAQTGESLMLLDARSVTALRTGAVAAVATQALARADARTVGLDRVRPSWRLGRAVPGGGGVRAGRVPRPARGTSPPCSRTSSSWRTGSREEAIAL